MKLRIIPLGKGKLDPRSFGFQSFKAMKLFYLRLWFFGILLSLSGYDPAADLQSRMQDRKAKLETQKFLYGMNRHQRRAFIKQATKHAQAH